MELAVLLAAGVREWIDFGVIIGILLLNAVVGWYQEKQAADVVASLKGDIAMRSTVIRDGSEVEIKARELVPGDIVSASKSHGLTGDIDWSRSLLRTVKSSPLMLELFPLMTTPMAGQSSRRSWSARLARRSNTTARMKTTLERSTALAMLYSPLINLP
jgi:hypothetical protein